jgi:hypothetical protein
VHRGRDEGRGVERHAPGHALRKGRLQLGAAERATPEDLTDLRGLAEEFAGAFVSGDRAIARGIC